MNGDHAVADHQDGGILGAALSDRAGAQRLRHTWQDAYGARIEHDVRMSGPQLLDGSGKTRVTAVKKRFSTLQPNLLETFVTTQLIVGGQGDDLDGRILQHRKLPWDVNVVFFQQFAQLVIRELTAEGMQGTLIGNGVCRRPQPFDLVTE